MPPTSTPKASPDPLTCAQIADHIFNIYHVSCNRSTVWRIIRRLSIEPSLRVSNICLYGPEVVDKVAKGLRAFKSEAE